jgi:hypothetical protein
MKTEFMKQYAHTWRIFERVVKAFDQDAWLYTGRGTTTPARTAFHILQGVKYYMEDTSTIVFASGKSFESHWETVKAEELPSQNDILVCIEELKQKRKSGCLTWTLPLKTGHSVGQEKRNWGSFSSCCAIRFTILER